MVLKFTPELIRLMIMKLLIIILAIAEAVVTTAYYLSELFDKLRRQ